MAASESEVVTRYEHLSALVAHMAQLARNGSWDMLPELERQCAAVVDDLRRLQGAGALDDAACRAALADLLERIRADQEEIEQLVRPQLQQLVRRMELLQQGRKVLRAYGQLH